ncbi:MAG TPA: hemerythrin domain-containing protein [Thermoanaerobaculia bacterium]
MLDAVEILERDHERILRLLRELDTTASSDRKEHLFDLAEEALQIHSAIEEDYFYPAVRRAACSSEGEEVYIKSREEHKLVDMVMPHLRMVDTGSEVFTAKIRLVRQLVAHHIEEERQHLLPLAREVLSREELEDLAGPMLDTKRALRGKVILAAQSRAFDCDRDGCRIVGPGFMFVWGVGC